MESGIDRDLAAAREIALYAGTELESETGKLRTIDHKSATDMVTELDRRVERRICAELARRFPDDGILAEEGGRREGRRRWIVDPLDGTTNYVHGHPFYAVSLARVDEDGPQIAAVYAQYPHIGAVLPAMGYSAGQLAALRASINAAEADVVVAQREGQVADLDVR